MLRLSLVFAAATLLVSPAIAEDYFAPDVAVPAAVNEHGRTIDIVGLLPGMTTDEVRTALEERFSSRAVSSSEQTFQFSSRGVSVVMQPFIAGMEARGDNEAIEVTFTGPAGGNQSFFVSRRVSYQDVLTAPAQDDVVAALIEKYGEPSDRITNNLYWAVADQKPVACRGYSCSSGSMGYYRPQDLGRYANQQLDSDLVIKAEIGRFFEDETKVRSLTVAFGDMALRQAAAAADMTALIDEAERVHSASSTAGAVPDL